LPTKRLERTSVTFVLDDPSADVRYHVLIDRVAALQNLAGVALLVGGGQG
jgi:hypothetical protein